MMSTVNNYSGQFWMPKFDKPHFTHARNGHIKDSIKLMMSMVNNYSGQFWVQMATIIPKIDHYEY